MCAVGWDYSIPDMGSSILLQHNHAQLRGITNLQGLELFQIDVLM